MSLIRSQVRFQGDTNTPEDVYVNTWYFDSGTDGFTQTVVDEIAADLQTFYFTAAPLTSLAVKAFLGPSIASAELRCYDMSDAEPRVPLYGTLTYGSATINGPIPAECSCVLSYNAGPPVTGRRRGRIYLGPLSTEALQSGQTSDARVSANMYETVAQSAYRLIDTGDHPWVVYSPTGNSYAPVVGGHVDNAFDIQRRRGHEATYRELWGA